MRLRPLLMGALVVFTAIPMLGATPRVSGAPTPSPEPTRGDTQREKVGTIKLKPIVITRVVRVKAKPQETASAPPRSPAGPGGSSGFIMPGFNCVACVQALTGRAQSGNAGSHAPSFSTPRVGAIMIWYPGEQGAGPAGHVGVVKGINPDGSVNIAHCNWGGGQTVFASTGKFY